MAQLYSHLCDEINQDAIITVTHLRILLQVINTKQMIAPLLTTVWDHTGGCAKQYRCASSIPLLSCIDL